MMLHALALMVGQHAARILHPVRPVQAIAMFAELEHLEGAEAMAWALGCLSASYRLRASFLAVAIVGARLGVATTAGLFGLVHVLSSSRHLWTKTQLITGEALATHRMEYIRAIDARPLEHWLWLFLTASTLGLLHLAAALMMATGRNDRVLKLAIVIVGFDLIMPLAGMGEFTLPALYMGLITLMALVSSGLAWAWRWDERRVARSSASF
jgi:hypothetical protein